jgi:PIN domain nuclease of toxin-antitoxin system
MSDVLADTHSIVWFLFDPSRLSPAADAALTTAGKSVSFTRLSVSSTGTHRIRCGDVARDVPFGKH